MAGFKGCGCLLCWGWVGYKFISTLDKYMDKITNYFVNRQTGGFVDGLNNTIKVIKRRCYDLPNVKHLFQRIYLDLEGTLYTDRISDIIALGIT